MPHDYYLKARELVRSHEGERLFPYLDASGDVDIGVGRNLTKTGISHDESEMLLANDLTRRIIALQHQPWWEQLSDNRKAALIDVMMPVGVAGFGKFERMIAALARGDFQTVAAELLDSLFARQDRDRAQEDAELLRRG